MHNDVYITNNSVDVLIHAIWYSPRNLEISTDMCEDLSLSLSLSLSHSLSLHSCVKLKSGTVTDNILE